MSDKMIDPQAAVDYMIAKAGEYAKAKSDRIYCEEYRKSLKSMLMKDALAAGHNAANAQEREAYASDEYIRHLKALREAVETEENLRWMLIAAEARIEVWRSQEASKRSEIKMTM
jgi:hypothetical protein